MRQNPTISLAASVILALSAGTLQAHDHSAHAGHGQPADPHAGHAQHAAAAPTASTVQVTLTDTALLDQNGLPRKIRSDVVGDRIVVMDFVYTTCTTICPAISGTFAKVQRQLGDALGKDVSLVTITVDPARDTPAVLKAYGAKHGARDGWMWLTGAPQSVNGVLKGFGAYVPDPAQHPAMVLVGDGRTGQWTRFFGFPSTEQLMARIDELRLARRSAEAARKGNG